MYQPFVEYKYWADNKQINKLFCQNTIYESLRFINKKISDTLAR